MLPDNCDKNKILTIIEKHMDLLSLITSHRKGEVTDKAYKRYARRPYIAELIAFSRADLMASNNDSNDIATLNEVAEIIYNKQIELGLLEDDATSGLCCMQRDEVLCSSCGKCKFNLQLFAAPSIPDNIHKIMTTMMQSGYECYIVGGFVRDYVLGNSAKDCDLCTNAMPSDTKAILSSLGNIIDTNGEKHGTVVVVIDGEQVEVTTYRADGEYSDGRRPDSVKLGVTVQEDVNRRDLTINGLLMDINGDIVDFVGGRQDMLNNIIKMIGNPEHRIQEDALRMLRAIRFAARLGFNIESRTLQAIKNNASSINKVSMERIRDEITKSLSYNTPLTIQLLVKTGLMDIIFPGKPLDFVDAFDLLPHKVMPEIIWAKLIEHTAPIDYKLQNTTKKTIVDIKCALEQYNKLSYAHEIWYVSAIEMKKLKIQIDNACRYENFIHYIKLNNVSDSLYNTMSKVSLTVSDYVRMVSGKDLIAAGVKPGKHMKAMLDKAYDMQLEGFNKQYIVHYIADKHINRDLYQMEEAMNNYVNNHC